MHVRTGATIDISATFTQNAGLQKGQSELDATAKEPNGRGSFRFKEMFPAGIGPNEPKSAEHSWPHLAEQARRLVTEQKNAVAASSVVKEEREMDEVFEKGRRDAAAARAREMIHKRRSLGQPLQSMVKTESDVSEQALPVA